jgi:DNA-binding CsgD family transcriptional regulator
MELIKYDDFKQTWRQIAKHTDENIPATFELAVYKKLLNLFHVGDYYYYIINMAAVKMEFCSESVQNVLGVSPSDFSVEKVVELLHPDDKAVFLAQEQTLTHFFNQLSPEKILKYKISHDYRLRCANGSYKWILQQGVAVQTNEIGSVIRALVIHTDITHLKTENKHSGVSFIGLDGEPSYYNVPLQTTVFLPSTEVFSGREKEILQLVISGKSTIEIAKQLHVSIHTVNTHRKNILSKSGCNSLAELGSKAVKEGWV